LKPFLISSPGLLHRTKVYDESSRSVGKSSL
jgi:hypothetical protein